MNNEKILIRSKENKPEVRLDREEKNNDYSFKSGCREEEKEWINTAHDDDIKRRYKRIKKHALKRSDWT